MPVGFIHRGLSAEGNMAAAAANYERSTAGIVLEVIVGLLTAGVGVVGFEVYHHLNKSEKNKEFSELAEKLLMSMKEAPGPVNYKEFSILVEQDGANVKVTLGDEIRIIENKSIAEIRENLKKEILSNGDKYGCEAAKLALQDTTGNQRALAVQLLQSKTNVKEFDHFSTKIIVDACVGFVEKMKAEKNIEDEFNAIEKNRNMGIDAESAELIKSWMDKNEIKKSAQIGMPAVGDKKNMPAEIAGEAAVRRLVADLIFPEKQWTSDPGKRGRGIKLALQRHSCTLVAISKDPRLIDLAGLPAGICETLKAEMGKLPKDLNEAKLRLGLFIKPNEFFNGIGDDIDKKVDEFKLGSQYFVQKLSGIDGLGEGNLQKFLKNILKNYFDNQPNIDKRAMLASYLRNSGSEDNDESELIGLLKGGGPYLQKMLQLLGDNAEGDLKTKLEAMKGGLSPIDEDVVKAILAGIVDKSGGAITKIDVVGDLGAASVGQTVLVNIHWKGREAPQEAVVKMLRPGIRLRAARELAFFEAEAAKIPGMLKTFNGISEQIKVEMDLTKEANNVRLAQVYNSGPENLRSMQLVGQIPPSQGYMVIAKAPGTTVTSALAGLNGKAPDQKGISGSTQEKIGIKLAFDVKALCKKWIEEGLFGSGFYHGDLHSGNIMFSPDPRSGITVIDLGNAAVLSLDQKRAVFNMVVAASYKDAERFVANYEKVMSPEGKVLIGAIDQAGASKRAKLIAETRDRMALDKTGDAGAIIKLALDAANELGLEVPATVSNFSRSQIMLQNVVDNINSANEEIIRILGKYIEVNAPIYLHNLAKSTDNMSRDEMLAYIHRGLKEKYPEIEPKIELGIDVQQGKQNVFKLMEYVEILQSGKLGKLDFADIIINVIQENKWKAVQLGGRDLLVRVAKNAFC